jgi:hypothetical protein
MHCMPISFKTFLKKKLFFKIFINKCIIWTLRVVSSNTISGATTLVTIATTIAVMASVASVVASVPMVVASVASADVLATATTTIAYPTGLEIGGK